MREVREGGEGDGGRGREGGREQGREGGEEDRDPHMHLYGLPISSSNFHEAETPMHIEMAAVPSQRGHVA